MKVRYKAICPSCGNQAKVQMEKESGTTNFVRDNDNFCSECGSEMELIEPVDEQAEKTDRLFEERKAG